MPWTSTIPNTHQRLISNFIALIVDNLFRIVSFAATPYIAWKLGPAGYGAFSSALVVALALSLLLNVGLDSLMVREGGSVLLGEATLLKLIVVPPALLGLLLLAYVSPGNTWLYLCFLIYSLINSYLLLFSAVFRALERMTLPAVLQAALLSYGALLLAIVHSLTRRWSRPVAASAAKPPL